jgi:hypothetical protein
MRKAVVTGVAVAVTTLGLVLGLTGVSNGPSPIRSAADPMLVNAAKPVCPPC